MASPTNPFDNLSTDLKSPNHGASPAVSEQSAKLIIAKLASKHAKICLEMSTFFTRMMELGHGPLMKQVCAMKEPTLVKLLMIFEDAAVRLAMKDPNLAQLKCKKALRLTPQSDSKSNSRSSTKRAASNSKRKAESPNPENLVELSD